MAGRWLPDQISFQKPVPKDLEQAGIIAHTTLLYDPLDAVDRETLRPLDNNALLKQILKNSDIDILLRTIGNAFFPRVVTVGTSPTLLIAPNRYPRGYILINPNTTVSSVATSVTVFPAATVFPVGTTTSAAINVGGHGGAAFFANVTDGSAGPGTSVNVQSQDPISGNWATVQTDIFGWGGLAPVGTFYANIGAIGVDVQMRLQVVVGGDSMTASIAAVLKPSLAGTIAGPTAFIGNEDVNLTIGYPVLSGQKEVFYLRENTPLFGIAAAPVNLNIFELQ